MPVLLCHVNLLHIEGNTAVMSCGLKADRPRRSMTPAARQTQTLVTA